MSEVVVDVDIGPTESASLILRKNGNAIVRKRLELLDTVNYDMGAKQWFFSSASILNFPTIARAFKHENADDEIPDFVEYEYCPGDSLRSIITEKVQLTYAEKLIIAYGLSRSLQYLARLRERPARLDLNPDNIILDTNMYPVIIRSTLDVCINQASLPTYKNLVYVFPSYRKNPFQKIYHNMVKCDIYSLAAIIYFLVFEKDPPLSLNENDLNGDEPLLGIINMCLGEARADTSKIVAKLEELGEKYPEFCQYKETLNRKVEKGEWAEAGDVNAWGSFAFDVTPSLGRKLGNIYLKLDRKREARSCLNAAAAFDKTGVALALYRDLVK